MPKLHNIIKEHILQLAVPARTPESDQTDNNNCMDIAISGDPFTNMV